MKIRNTAIKLIALVSFIAIGAVWMSPNAKASEDFVRSTGMFGITKGQTARLNVVMVNNIENRPCEVGLSFIDYDGNVIAQKTHELYFGWAAFLDVKAGDVADRYSKNIQTREKGREDLDYETTRTQMRAVVQFADDIADSCIITIEVFDSRSGETKLLIPIVQKAEKPTPW